MAKVACPQKCRHGYHLSSGDGWSEWDECRCCNKDGRNDSGMVSEWRVRQFTREEAAEAARWDRIIADYEAAEKAMDAEYGPELPYIY